MTGLRHCQGDGSPRGIRTARLLPTGLLVLIALAGLSACDRDQDDLDAYIQETLDREGGEIEPIPQIEPTEPYDYTGHTERSPFEPDERIDPELAEGDPDDEGPSPDPDRRQEFLEQFTLDSLEMQGILELGGQLYALIRDPDGVVHRVTVGNYMGQNHGEVVEISETEVRLNELVSDGTGGWNEREARLSLSE